ncbi:PilZ domain-containing protein [Endozoicomonas sp. SM1973]|uniref:PilZ domain-containing protein n=1 Tax=Spartinivicinus marinus TaxID=2994442 RepID=A0A853I6Z1_9GAMM|nr:PilZ domain-containing protein [Spartinivicinus marinus]MCX4027396.1 PilZ domain-containing protein [Spartinivicinus marinus]NYZ66428.1 PilZ domain-containing protein [Spartinivicinus marinus]
MQNLKHKESRQFSRKSIKWPAIIKHSGNMFRVTTLNISETGVLVESPIKLRVGQQVALMIKGHHNGDKMTIYAKSHIKHVVIKLHYFQLGLEFIEIPKAAKTFLAKFIEGL